MPQTTEFELTHELITLLRASNVDHRLSDMEYGAAWIDPKRPYGNSDVETDIAEQLGWAVGCDGLSQDERDQARELHAQTPTALQVVLSTGLFEPGIYRRTREYGTDWELVTPTRGYAVLTENNEWEGETWRFYIPTHGNTDALAALKTAIDGMADDDDDTPSFELDLDPIPAHVVEVLADYDSDDDGYMSRHNRLEGKLVLTPEFLEKLKLNEGDRLLYKGGIRELMK